MTLPPCGVVGAGAIGRGLSASLVRAGAVVAVYDVDEHALRRAVESGATPVASPAELARAAEVVFLALPDTPEIFAAVDDGLSGALRPGSTVIITSTVSPETPRELERLLAPAGVDVLDAPVSGGPVRAAAGELAIMVGGPEELFESRREVLEALASHLVHVGPTGHGELAKLVNNLMGAVIVLGIAEGLALAAKAGTDVRRVCEAIAGGSGSSWILREWIPDTVFRGDYERRFSLDLMRKDMGLIEGLAGDLGVAVPAVELARATFEEAIAAGFGDRDFSVIAALQAEAAGTELPGGPPPGGAP
jgi:3-hydroxyisobutyrate dehydrogenase-like beta-hydroxyacid dehydrogenase